MSTQAGEAPSVETARVVLLARGGEAAVTPFCAMDGSAARAVTTARVTDADGALVVTVRCADADIRTDPAHGPGHPDLWKDDSVELFLDPGHLHERASDTVHVIVTAAGAAGSDTEGDAARGVEGLSASAARTADGWDAVIRIPWKALGGRPADGTVWGFNLGRSDYPQGAYSCFSPTYRGFWQMRGWGHLVFAPGGAIPETAAARLSADHARAEVLGRLAANPLGSDMPADLAALTRHMPGTGSVCAWTRNGTRRDVPALAGDSPAAVRLPRGVVAVGAAWTVRHAVDRLSLSFAGDAAPALPPALEVHDGAGWVPWRDGLKARNEGGRWLLEFEPVVTDAMRVLVPEGSRPFGLQIHRYLAEAAKPEWPRRVATPELTQDFLARPSEPSFESLALHGLSTPAWAMTGLKDTGREQAVAWDGQIHCHGRRLRLLAGEQGLPLGWYRDTIRRSLLEGWMPAVSFQARAGDLEIAQTSFSIFTDGPGRDREALFVDVAVRNAGRSAFDGPLVLEVSDAPKDPFEGTLGVPVHVPPIDRTPSVWQLRGRTLLRNGRVFLVAASPCRAGARSSAVAFDLALAPGRTATVRYVVPSPDWEVGEAEATALAAYPPDAALKRFRAYWQELLAPAATLELPEKRLERMYKAVLAQLFISGYGDRTAYGAAPSNYDGAAFDGELPFATDALAMSGFGADAQRYLTTLIAASEPSPDSDAGAIGNGLRAVAVAETFRLTGDRTWLAAQIASLRRGAEWTLARRRQAQGAGNGNTPLYQGLLPPGQSGGDFSRAGHALFPNLACWRGLKDTAWLLDALGDAETAARYRTEAQDFHRAILGVADRICRRDRTPPFLPLMTDETEPKNGDYYQLMTHFTVNLWPFDLADPRANLIPAFIEADNRTFCMLPRFRDDGVPGGHRTIGDGGIDGIYALGPLLQCLQQGRIREYELGLYAFLVFNMEHECFTSREGNRVFSSDLHLRTPFPLSDWSDPLTCSSAVALLLLRHMLVAEEIREAGEYTGGLLLLHGAPRRWFAPGQRIAVRGAPTHAGPVSFEVVPGADGSRIAATVTVTGETRCPGIKIRLRHPRGAPMREVLVDGRPHAAFDAASETVELPKPAGTVRIEARYGEPM